jgi:hypothetical protein
LFEFNEKNLFLHLDFVLLTVVSIFLLFVLASLGFSSRADLVLSIFLFPSLSLPGPVRAELFLLESQSSAGVRSSTFPRFHRRGFFLLHGLLSRSFSSHRKPVARVFVSCSGILLSISFARFSLRAQERSPRLRPAWPSSIRRRGSSVREQIVPGPILCPTVVAPQGWAYFRSRFLLPPGWPHRPTLSPARLSSSSEISIAARDLIFVFFSAFFRSHNGFRGLFFGSVLVSSILKNRSSSFTVLFDLAGKPYS